MKHESKESSLIVNKTEVNFNTWLNKEYITADLRPKLSDKDILLIPIEGFRDLEFPVFPVKTEEVFNFLKSQLPGDISVDICIEDKDYKEVALHSDLVVIVSFIVTSVALPILINLLSAYISSKIIKYENSKVKVSITAVKKDGNSFNIDYEGTAKDFNSITDKTKDLVE